MKELSIRDAFFGKNLLVTGASGFVGKVWLAMLIEQLPSTGRIYILLRPGRQSAEERLRSIWAQSPVFRRRAGRNPEDDDQQTFNRLIAIDGDVSKPNLGIDTDLLEVVRREVDLVVNFAGLVDFDPDVRDALAANVRGPLRVAELVRSCSKARLLHVSTAFVSGMRAGRIRERIETLAPNGDMLDAEAEWHWLRENIEREQAAGSESSRLDAIRQELQGRGHDCCDCKQRRCVAPSLAASRLRSAMTTLGHQRAQAYGWTNTYTYSKSLAERLLLKQPDLKVCIFRPTIVESAASFPFSGWNEGFNTSGPIIQLLGTWLRRIPVGTNKKLDLIPVDFVAKGLMIAAAALLRDEHATVYHCGSSDRNPIPVVRCVELSALAHRVHLREHGKSWMERHVLSRWDARPVSHEPWFGLPRWRKLTSQVSRLARNSAFLASPRRRPHIDVIARRCDVLARKLSRLEAILETYEPFLSESPSIYECQALARHLVVEPEFRFEPERIDWHDYMLNCHVPGIRKWCIQDSASESPTVGSKAAISPEKRSAP